MFVLVLRLLPVCDCKRITLHIVLTILNAKQQTGKSFQALTGIIRMCAGKVVLADALPMIPGRANTDQPGAGQAARHPENK